MHKIVVDASVSVKWINSKESYADKAASMLEDYRNGDVLFLVPSFWAYEVVNAVNKAVARADVSPEDGDAGIDALLNLGIELHSTPTPKIAYQLARKYQRSIYDSFYLDLAEKHKLELWTADQRLYNATKDKLPFVKWIGNYKESRKESTE